MEFKTHWLLRIRGAEALHEGAGAPEWAREALRRAAWVVVRRAQKQDGMIPVGVRGAPGRREQRYAAWIREEEVLEWKSPRMLVTALLRKVAAGKAARRASGPDTGMVGSTLRIVAVAQVMEEFGLGECWGPGGSVGFELASGVTATTPDSDLDLIIEVKGMNEEFAQGILRRLPQRVDVLLETEQGGIVLADYANNPTYVVRTKEGPRLHGCLSVPGAGFAGSGVSTSPG